MNSEVDAGGVMLAAQVDTPAAAIAKLEFFDGGRLIGIVTKAPFTLTYHPDKSQLNFRITAKATNVSGESAVSPPVTCVAASRIVRKYKSYDYKEMAEDKVKEVRLTLPEGLGTVRGILVVSNPAGNDTRDSYKEAWYGEFLYLHGFAFLGAKEFDSHIPSLQVMQHALEQIATDSNHPELVDVPYATTGFSAGGGFASRLLVEVPDRVIACVVQSSRLNFTGITPSAANMATPACIISGEKETQVVTMVEPVLEACRPKGALFGWITIQGGGHTRSGQEVLAMPYLDAAVRLRYPQDGDVTKGPVKLTALPPDSGWVADNTTWKSGLTMITPAQSFTGTIGKSSWLPTEDVACIYRAYATYDRPLTITAPTERHAWDPGSNITIVVDDAKFPGWKKLVFYDGARKLGEISSGPSQFTAMDLTPGFHAFSVLGTDDKDSIRPSNPVLVVVRKLPVRVN